MFSTIFLSLRCNAFVVEKKCKENTSCSAIIYNALKHLITWRLQPKKRGTDNYYTSLSAWTQFLVCTVFRYISVIKFSFLKSKAAQGNAVRLPSWEHKGKKKRKGQWPAARPLRKSEQLNSHCSNVVFNPTLHGVTLWPHRGRKNAAIAKRFKNER